MFEEQRVGIRSRAHELLSSAMYWRRWAPPTALETSSASQLRARVSILSSEISASKDAVTISWESHCRNLQSHILTADPRQFLMWPEVRYTMFIAHAGFIRKELRFLQSLTDWHSRWQPALVENSIGSPARYVWAPKSSANLIHHAYQIALWEKETSSSISDMGSIVEFGGGYGSMCRLAWRLGFRGQYTIYDLEPFVSLQQYYLASIGVPQKGAGKSDIGFSCTTSMEAVNQNLSVESRENLLIATWSLSESPLAVRDRFRPIVQRCDNLLISYQGHFDDIDNIKYFEELLHHRHGTDSVSTPLVHQPGNFIILSAPEAKST